jgi:hypothetical protein
MIKATAPMMTPPIGSRLLFSREIVSMDKCGKRCQERGKGYGMQADCAPGDILLDSPGKGSSGDPSSRGVA